MSTKLSFALRRQFLSAFLMALLLTNLASVINAQKFEPNYDESKVPAYDLPPLWDDTTAAADDFAAAWDGRRLELLGLFAEQMYGQQPTEAFQVSCEKMESGESLNGKALRQQYQVNIETAAGKHSFDLLVYTPKLSEGAVPAFLGLNFYGNHTVAGDPEIRITKSWCRATADKGVVDNRATEAGRSTSALRWPIEMIVDAGYGVATVYCGDIDPDYDDNFQNGVHTLFPDHRPGPQAPDRWGTISAWAWGLSRALDCLSHNVDEVDGSRVVVIGHSRLGKTSLWAGATDERFAGAISNDSGCGGAALSRRAFGETVERINTSFPHWFCGNFKQYNRNENALPVDQHQLIALLAPRPVYVASASQDEWADPKGEFLAAKTASAVYEKLGSKPFALNAFPQPGEGALGTVSYHLREGEHDINTWDWERYLKFMQTEVDR
ncbi:MAG: acetylxylan esterase [bacterium]|nr:acetylxylan esterase [bacterium]